MLAIIGLHYFNGNMGGALENIPKGSFNYYTTYFCESMFIVGVGCFVLITGYFQVNKKSIKVSKALNLFIVMTFYEVFFYIIMSAFNIIPFSIKGLIKSAIPFLLGGKWFVKIYIILFLLSPFINLVLNSIDKKVYKQYLGILIVTFSIWPSFIPSPPNNDFGYGIITFILLYSLGGYLRIHYDTNKSWKVYLLKFLFMVTATFLLKFTIFGVNAWSYNFILNVLGAMYIFLVFLNLNISSKLINYIATFSFVVYLIHTDPSINRFLYDRILRTNLYWNKPYYILHMFVSLIVVYSLCMSIDIIIKKIFKIIRNKFTNKKIFNEYDVEIKV